jgi:membrane dipeptidase
MGSHEAFDRYWEEQLAAAPTSVDQAGGHIRITPEALRIHRSAIVFDGHNDLPLKIRTVGSSSFEQLDIAEQQPELHTDIPRLRAGGVGAQFWSAYVPPEKAQEGGAALYALEQIDLIHRMADHYPDHFAMAYTADDVLRARRRGKIACLIGIEGGHAIENSLAALRMFYALGARYMTLTHVDTNDWADSATDEARHDGLTPFGEEVVREMNRLGMLVDISHISAEAMRDVLRVAQAPVIASHSSAYAVAPTPRNVPDDVLRLIADNGGVVMVNFYSGFVHPEAARVSQEGFELWRRLRERGANEKEMRKAFEEWRREHPTPRGTVRTVVDHIDHIARVAGIDHVGLGSDYDGITIVPDQLDDVSCYPYITQELLNRGYSASEIRKILGGNALRALREAEDVAANAAG